MTSAIRLAVDRGLAPGGDLAGELTAHGHLAIATAEEAAALDDALAASLGSDAPALRAALGLMQAIDGREAFDVLACRAVPRLAAFVEGALGSSARADPELVLFALKVLAMYQAEAAPGLVAEAAARADCRHHPLWPILFRAFDAPHPHRRVLAEAFAADPPDGAAGVAALDYCTRLVRDGEIVFHPYDTPPGLARLAGWLEGRRSTDRDAPTATGLAPDATAAAALSHVGGAERDRLLGLALVHSSPRVRLEAATAAARLDRPEGIEGLARLCLDRDVSHAARGALAALGRDDAVPAAALAPEFAAVAEFSDWLAHPLEFGRAPDAIDLLDARELLWPPANDLRRLHLVHYAYEGDATVGRARVEGVGLVGSVTFELRGETSPAMPPLDVYALHCCWELQVGGDPRAPERRSIAAGRRLLGVAADACDPGERGASVP